MRTDKILVESYEYVYRYEGRFYTLPQVLKQTDARWLNVKTNVTKKKILTEEHRFIEAPDYIEIQAMVPLFENYYITNGGYILTTNLVEVKLTNNSIARLTNNGDRETYYLKDLLYYAFIDPTINPQDDLIWVVDLNVRNIKMGDITLDTIEKKDAAVKKVTTTPSTPNTSELDNALRRIKELEEENAKLRAELAASKKPAAVDNYDENGTLRVDQVFGRATPTTTTVTNFDIAPTPATQPKEVVTVKRSDRRH